MKKLIVIGVLCLFSFSAQAQNAASGKSRDSLIQKNHISAGPFPIAFGKIQIEYERAINKNMTVGLELGNKFSSGIFKVSGINTPLIITNDFNFKGIELQPEYRWYLQRTNRAYTGFYTGAYYRLRSYKDQINGIYASETAGNQRIDMAAKISSHTLGLELGYKLPIKSHFYVDFLIAGPGVSFNKIALENNNTHLAETFYNDVAAALKNKYEILNGISPNMKFNGNGNTTRSAKFELPAFNYGIKAGYSF